MRILLAFWAVVLVTALPGNNVLAQTAPAPAPIRSDKPFVMVDQMPEFIGGNQALIKYLKKQVKPTGLVSGMAVVSFVVHEDSTITNIKILKSLDKGIDESLMKAVSGMSGQWMPGKQFGVPVKVNKMLSLTFPLTQKSVGEVIVTAAP